MTIKTKYDLGQTLYYIGTHQIASGVVVGIETLSGLKDRGAPSSRIEQFDRYDVSGCNLVNEDEFYDTKQDAARAWLARAGLEPGLQDG